MALTYREGTEARRNGVDVVISLTADQVAALGTDMAELAEALDTALVALAAHRARTDPTVPSEATPSLKDQPVSAGAIWNDWTITDTTYLIERMTGLRAASVRQHADNGGTYGEVARDMNVSRATAQRRRDTITRKPASKGERWATTLPAPDAE